MSELQNQIFNLGLQNRFLKIQKYKFDNFLQRKTKINYNYKKPQMLILEDNYIAPLKLAPSEVNSALTAAKVKFESSCQTD